LDRFVSKNPKKAKSEGGSVMQRKAASHEAPGPVSAGSFEGKELRDVAPEDRFYYQCVAKPTAVPLRGLGVWGFGMAPTVCVPVGIRSYFRLKKAATPRKRAKRIGDDILEVLGSDDEIDFAA
jgi:hypothetical protein